MKLSGNQSGPVMWSCCDDCPTQVTEVPLYLAVLMIFYNDGPKFVKTMKPKCKNLLFSCLRIHNEVLKEVKINTMSLILIPHHFNVDYYLGAMYACTAHTHPSTYKQFHTCTQAHTNDQHLWQL